MELYIKQKVFSFKDHFSVTDDQGNQLYEVQGKTFSFKDQLTLTETNGTNQILIKEKWASWMPRYLIEQDDQVIFEVVKKFSFFKTNFDILPSNWNVEGEIFKHHYRLKDGSKELMFVRKEWLSWGDTYHVTIHDEQLVLPCLAIMIVLDMVLHSNKQNSHNHHNNMHHNHHH